LPNIIAQTFDLDTHPSIEAMVVDRADEIAYISHDIDDGVNSGLISFCDLKESELVSLVLKKVHDEGINEEEDEMFRYRFSSHLINHLVYSLLDYSKPKILNKELLSTPLDATQKLPIGFDAKLETDIKKLKKLLFSKMYQSKEIARKMYAGKQAIIGLYKALSEDENMLPKYYKGLLEVRKKHRVIADYIASMSDRYAFRLYNELYGKL